MKPSNIKKNKKKNLLHDKDICKQIIKARIELIRLYTDNEVVFLGSETKDDGSMIANFVFSPRIPLEYVNFTFNIGKENESIENSITAC